MTALAARRSAPQHWAPWMGNRPPSTVTRTDVNAGSSTVRSSSPPSLWPEWTADAMVDGAGASPIVVTVRSPASAQSPCRAADALTARGWVAGP